MSLAVGDERRLEVRSADGARVVRVLGELQRALDVLACGLVVALAAPAARAPREDVRTQRVGRQARPLGEPEGLVEQGERGLDAVQLIPADSERVENLGPLDVGEASVLDEAACLVEQPERAAQGTEAHLRAAGSDEGANLELQEPGGAGGRDEHVVLRGGLLVAPGLDQRLGPGECALETAALVGGDTVREEAGVDP